MSEHTTDLLDGAPGAGEVVWVRTTVNGRAVDEVVESRLTLADFLRGRLRLTGTHLGCEHGVCGACTVLLDGDAVRSCLTLAAQADGHEIETVEGLADEDGSLSPLQDAFSCHHALQCGFCTAGFLMTGTAVLREGPVDTPEEAREALSGNICRCTGYRGLVEALVDASDRVHGGAPATAEPTPAPDPAPDGAVELPGNAEVPDDEQPAAGTGGGGR